MSKRKVRLHRKRFSTTSPGRGRSILGVVVIVLALSLAGGLFAQWGSLRMVIMPRATAPAAAPQSLPGAGSPSKENVYAGGRLLATNEAATTPLGAPGNLVATVASTTQVNLTWNAATGSVDHYQVQRSQSVNGPYTVIANPTTTSYSDTTAGSGIAYLYRVAAVDAIGDLSGFSNLALATTILFTDEPLTATVTQVKAQHINELRQAVNAVRQTAALAAATWTNPSLVAQSSVIYAVDVQELRNNLNPALSAIGLTVPSYTDSPLTVGTTTIKAVHIEELRHAVN